MGETMKSIRNLNLLGVVFLMVGLSGCLLTKDPIFADEQCGEVECGEVRVDGETYQCGTCKGTTYCSEEKRCIDDCAGRVCGLSPLQGFDCGVCGNDDDYCDEDGQCVAACEGRVCGKAPNGRDCGTCPGITDICSSAGQCEDGCVNRECGPNQDGVSCGECVGNEYCEDARCIDACAGLQCGDVTAASKTFTCGTCTGATEACEQNLCVDHGSVESCGTCTGEREVCSGGNCIDDCGSQQCGESPHGFDCGECPVGSLCNNLNFQGICDDVCGEYECGPAPWHSDVSCGECETSEICYEHACLSDCKEGWFCGPTQHEGGSCGTCETGLECINRGCTDGTWTDSETGFMWSVPRYETSYTQADAIQYCDDLVLAGYSDWRLPEISELTTLLRGCVDGQATGDFSRSTCAVGLDNCLESACGDTSACQRCDLNSGPGRWGDYIPEDFYGVDEEGNVAYLWSRSPVSDDETQGWLLYLNTAFFRISSIEFDWNVTCVRAAKK